MTELKNTNEYFNFRKDKTDLGESPVLAGSVDVAEKYNELQSTFVSTLDTMPKANKEVLIKTERGLITNAIFDGKVIRPDQPYPLFWRSNDGYGFTVSAIAYEWCDIPA